MTSPLISITDPFQFLPYFSHSLMLRILETMCSATSELSSWVMPTKTSSPALVLEISSPPTLTQASKTLCTKILIRLIHQSHQIGHKKEKLRNLYGNEMKKPRGKANRREGMRDWINKDYYYYCAQMELQQSNFFATELQDSNRYSIADQQDMLPAEGAQKKSPSQRVREAKSEMKKIGRIYNESLKGYLRAKNSLDETNRKTHILRNDFIKLYGNRKHKFMNKSLLEQRKNEEEDFRREISSRTRSLKMTNELAQMYTRNEWEAHNQKNKEQNRRGEEIFRKTLRVKRKEQNDMAREKFMAVKRGETEFLIRKKNMSAMASTRARHNYLLKLGREMEMLEGYSKILEKAEGLGLHNPEMMAGLHNPERMAFSDSFDKTFFVTTKNTFRD